MVALYYVKTRAQSAKSEVSRLERLVKTEQGAVNVLKAELAHLETPARLGELAETELGLTPIKVEKTVQIEDITTLFPVATDIQP